MKLEGTRHFHCLKQWTFDVLPTDVGTQIVSCFITCGCCQRRWMADNIKRDGTFIALTHTHVDAARKLPTVFVVYSYKVCNHPREQHCWDCTPAVPCPVDVYRRRQEAEVCAQNLVRLWVNENESRTVEHISHREEKDTVSPSNLCALNDTWIVRMGYDHMEICVLATGLRNLR